MRGAARGGGGGVQADSGDDEEALQHLPRGREVDLRPKEGRVRSASVRARAGYRSHWSHRDLPPLPGEEDGGVVERLGDGVERPANLQRGAPDGQTAGAVVKRQAGVVKQQRGKAGGSPAGSLAP
jgi:hypothetical protein